MLVRLLLIFILIMISLFCTISLLNPLDIEFNFFGKLIPTDLSAIMISSFILGAALVFMSTLTRDIKGAIEGYRKSRERRKGKSLKQELNKAMEEFIRGDLSKARSRFIELLKKDSSQIELYFRLSEIALKEANYEESLQWLEKAQWMDMGNVDIPLRRAEIYQRMKQPNEAVRILNHLVSRDETNFKALRSLREIYLENQKWTEAIQIQKSILKLTKGKKAEEEEILFYLGLKYEHAKGLLIRGGEDHLENALKEAKEIIREQKIFQPGFVLLGDVYLRMGRWTSAGKIWEKSFTRFNSVIFLLKLEELYLGRNDPTYLLRIYQRALKSSPDNWAIAFYYAKLCLRLEMLDEALEEIDEISLRLKDFPALHRLLAEIYLHKKDFGRAAQEFNKTFELSGASYLSFSCTTCERESKEWIAYCPQCHRWSTYTIKEIEKTTDFPSTPISFSERVYFPIDAQ